MNCKTTLSECKIKNVILFNTQRNQTNPWLREGIGLMKLKHWIRKKYNVWSMRALVSWSCHLPPAIKFNCLTIFCLTLRVPVTVGSIVKSSPEDNILLLLCRLGIKVKNKPVNYILSCKLKRDRRTRPCAEKEYELGTWESHISRSWNGGVGKQINTIRISH